MVGAREYFANSGKFSGEIPRRDSEASQEFESRTNFVHAWEVRSVSWKSTLSKQSVETGRVKSHETWWSPAKMWSGGRRWHEPRGEEEAAKAVNSQWRRE